MQHVILYQKLHFKFGIAAQIESALPYVCVDERRIRQVLINLLNNAVKFTPANGHITLDVEWLRCAELTPAERPDDLAKGNGEEIQGTINIKVSDTGIGIAPENLDKLFQPFVQIDSALNRQYNGTGLGLAMVQRIVELHQGVVTVTSEVGVGSCFTIQLPCVMCPLPHSAQLFSNTKTTDTRNEKPVSAMILLAEDNDANVATISSYLKAKGYQLLIADNGEEAIALAQLEQPDLILMDIQMPKMDGFKAMQYIRQDPSVGDIPMIAMTALAMNGDRERCLAAGAIAYISKPIKLRQLVTLIQQYL